MGSMPSVSFTNALNAHVNRLKHRNVPACANGCACDWDSSCIGNANMYYGGKATPKNIRIKLTNTCSYKIHIKSKAPCNTKTGKEITVIQPNQSATITDDFIAIAVVKGVTHAGDQFSVWVGDGTWMNLEMHLGLQCDTSHYIN